MTKLFAVFISLAFCFFSSFYVIKTCNSNPYEPNAHINSIIYLFSDKNMKIKINKSKSYAPNFLYKTLRSFIMEKVLLNPDLFGSLIEINIDSTDGDIDFQVSLLEKSKINYI